MKNLLLASAILALGMGAAQADYTVKGSVECPDILKEDGNENYREFNKWWLLGYVTARNYTADQSGGNGEVAKGIEPDSLYQMALSYCQANAGSDWDDAAMHVYDLLD